MPELPEVEAVRRALVPAMRRARIDTVELRRADLRRPFPADFVARIRGRAVRGVERRGKYLLVQLDSGDAIIMHLGMSGSFRIERPARRAATGAGVTVPDAHDHVVFTLSTGTAVIYNDPRRFGVMDLARAESIADAGPFRGMGPEPLSAGFDAAALARACAGKRTALKVALLDQHIVAGIGNIYASEALHRARLSPKRRASTIATPAGRPRPEALRLAAAIKAVLAEAIERKERPYRSGRFRVYEREGQPCLRRGCGGVVRRFEQAGRSTYWCPRCQR
jgi:formamidopyrimidine-DNA glycosylase